MYIDSTNTPTWGLVSTKGVYEALLARLRCAYRLLMHIYNSRLVLLKQNKVATVRNYTRLGFGLSVARVRKEITRRSPQLNTRDEIERLISLTLI